MSNNQEFMDIKSSLIQHNADETPTKSDKSNMSLQNNIVQRQEIVLSNELVEIIEQVFDSEKAVNIPTWKIEEKLVRSNLKTSSIEWNEDVMINSLETAGQNLLRLAGVQFDSNKSILVDKFFEDFDIKKIVWGLGAMDSYEKSLQIFIEFITENKEEFTFLFNHYNSYTGILKCFIVEAFYQLFHFEVPDIGSPKGIINKLELISLFKCINCRHHINFVHTSYMDGKCSNCKIIYEEKHYYNFDIENPVLKGGSVNKGMQKPYIFALLPDDKKTEYEPYFFTPEEYNIIEMEKNHESFIKLNDQGVKKFEDNIHRMDELNDILFALENLSTDFKRAYDKILNSLKIKVLEVWEEKNKVLKPKLKEKKQRDKFENYYQQANNKWNNNFIKFRSHNSKEIIPTEIPLTFDGILDALKIKLKMGKKIPNANTGSQYPQSNNNNINSKRKFDHMTREILEYDPSKPVPPILTTNTPISKRPRLKPNRKTKST